MRHFFGIILLISAPCLGAKFLPYTSPLQIPQDNKEYVETLCGTLKPLNGKLDPLGRTMIQMAGRLRFDGDPNTEVILALSSDMRVGAGHIALASNKKLLWVTEGTLQLDHSDSELAGIIAQQLIQ